MGRTKTRQNKKNARKQKCIEKKTNNTLSWKELQKFTKEQDSSQKAPPVVPTTQQSSDIPLEIPLYYELIVSAMVEECVSSTLSSLDNPIMREAERAPDFSEIELLASKKTKIDLSKMQSTLSILGGLHPSYLENTIFEFIDD